MVHTGWVVTAVIPWVDIQFILLSFALQKQGCYYQSHLYLCLAVISICVSVLTSQSKIVNMGRSTEEIKADQDFTPEFYGLRTKENDVMFYS